VKLLNVLMKILELTNEELSDLEWTKLTFERVQVETQDTDEEVFLRRMGMRSYFKELKMSMRRIREGKLA